jgi:hypothetical protein
MVTQIKQVILPSINGKTEVTSYVGTLSPSVTYEDVSDMFVDCSKTMKNQVQQMIKEGLTKFMSINMHQIHRLLMFL